MRKENKRKQKKESNFRIFRIFSIFFFSGQKGIRKEFPFFSHCLNSSFVQLPQTESNRYLGASTKTKRKQSKTKFNVLLLPRLLPPLPLADIANLKPPASR